jgi:hypothetical protein
MGSVSASPELISEHVLILQNKGSEEIRALERMEAGYKRQWWRWGPS